MCRRHLRRDKMVKKANKKALHKMGGRWFPTFYLNIFQKNRLQHFGAHQDSAGPPVQDVGAGFQVHLERSTLNPLEKLQHDNNLLRKALNPSIIQTRIQNFSYLANRKNSADMRERCQCG